MKIRLHMIVMMVCVSLLYMRGPVYANVVGWGTGSIPLVFGGYGSGYFDDEYRYLLDPVKGPLYGNFTGNAYGYSGWLDDWYTDARNLALTPIDDGDEASWKHDFCHKLMTTYGATTNASWNADDTELAKAVCDYFTAQRLSQWTPAPENSAGQAVKFFSQIVYPGAKSFIQLLVLADEATRTRAYGLFHEAYRWVNEPLGRWDRLVTFDNPWPKPRTIPPEQLETLWEVTYTRRSISLGNSSETQLVPQEPAPIGDFNARAAQYAQELHNASPLFNYRVGSIQTVTDNGTTYTKVATFQIQVLFWFDISPNEQLLTGTGVKVSRPTTTVYETRTEWEVTHTRHSISLGDRSETQTLTADTRLGDFDARAAQHAQELHNASPLFNYRVNPVQTVTDDGTTQTKVATFQIQVLFWFDISPNEQLLTGRSVKKSRVVVVDVIPAPIPPLPSYTEDGYGYEGAIPALEDYDREGSGIVWGFGNKKKVVCINNTTGERLLLAKDSLHTWDCQAAGFVVNPGDSVKIRVYGKGKADSSEIIGIAAGFETSSAACTNLTTGTRIRKLFQQETPVVNCTALGLTIRPGDRVVLDFQGRIASAP
jgi:hypothetical protein